MTYERELLLCVWKGLHSGGLSEWGCLQQTGQEFQYRIPRKDPLDKWKWTSRLEVFPYYSTFKINQCVIAVIQQTTLPWWSDIQGDSTHSLLFSEAYRDVLHPMPDFPLRTRMHPGGCSHTIDNILDLNVWIPSFGIMACFSMFKLFLCHANILFKSLFLLKLPSTPLKASFGCYVGDMAAFQTGNLSGRWFFLGQTIEPQPQVSSLLGKCSTYQCLQGKGMIHEQYCNEIHHIGWKRRTM